MEVVEAEEGLEEELEQIDREVEEEKNGKEGRGIKGKTVNFEPYRRLQLVEGTPADLEGVVQQEKAQARYEVQEEGADYGKILFMAGIFIIMVVLALVILSKVDTGALFGGTGGGSSGGGGGIQAAIMGLKMGGL